MNVMLAWNVLALICLALPSYIMIRACVEAVISSGIMDPQAYLGMIMIVGVCWCVVIGNIIYFREEGKR